jgi:hypothetical protein
MRCRAHLQGRVRLTAGDGVQHVAFFVGCSATAEECQGRFWQLQHEHRLKGTFSVEESAAVQAAVKEHGNDWIKVRPSLHGCLQPLPCADACSFIAAGGKV